MYSNDAQGLPAYAGQALIDSSCGNGAFCHSEYATGPLRYGVPLGLDFDMALVTDAAQTEVLRRGQLTVYNHRYKIYRQVAHGHMPPGHVGNQALAAARTYAGLPSIHDAAAHAILRNWLSCGSPVVERITPRPLDIAAVGAVVPAQPPSACASGLTSCGGSCVDLTSDSANCGMCDSGCPSGSACANSTCTCASGLSPCASGCVDLTSNVLNCGMCDVACTTGQVCYASMCSSSGCPTGTMDCGGSCVDVNTSVSNCGVCFNACTGGMACSGGKCVCSGSATLCGSACVDLTSDFANCGSCGHGCPLGATCVSSSCVCGTTGLTPCPDGCVDLTSTPSDCGTCGHVCATGESCRSSTCQSVSFSADIQPIFTSTCLGANCHAGTKPAEGMSLEQGKAYGNLVDVASMECTGLRRVQPGSDVSSYIINKLTGVGMCRGSQMPKIGVPLSTAQIATIRAWINAGAPNN